MINKSAGVRNVLARAPPPFNMRRAIGLLQFESDYAPRSRGRVPFSQSLTYKYN